MQPALDQHLAQAGSVLGCDGISRLMADLGVAAVIVDQQGSVEHFNSAAQTVFGYSLAEIRGSDWNVLTVDGTMLRKLSAQPLPATAEFFAKRAGGEIFPADVSLALLDTEGARRYVATFKDLSDYKQAEQALRDSESRFRDLAGSASDWFWETNDRHQLIFISQRIASVLGVNPSAIIGLTFEEQGLECSPEVLEQHRADLDGRKPFRDRIFHAGPTAGSDARTLRLSGIPVFDHHDKFIGYRGVGVDITSEVAARKMVRQVRKILEDSIDSLDDGVVVFGNDGRMVTCNGAYLKGLNLTDMADLVGKTFEQILRSYKARFDGEGREFESWIQDRISAHRLATGEPFTIRLTSGRWILARECRMRDGGVVGVRTDVTELKRREQELDALKTRYQLILNSAGEGIIGLDTSGVVSFANRTAHVLLGYEPDRLIGKKFNPHIQPKETPEHSIARIVGHGFAAHLTNQAFIRTDGQRMPVDYFAAPLKQGDATEGVVVVFQDATLRLQYESAMATVQQDLERLVAERTRQLSKEVDVRARTEVALRESRARMKAITDCLLEAVLVVNAVGDVMFANPAARHFLCTEDLVDLEGMPIDDLFILGGTHPVRFAQSPFLLVIDGMGAMKNDDAIFITSDKRSLAVAYACSPLIVEGGPQAAIISFRDIRELKDAQWDAMQASRLASVGQLAAGIAHEINTPTQYIGDNLRFIQDAFQSFQKIVAAAVHGAEQFPAEASSRALKQIIDETDIGYLIEEVPVAISQSQQGVEQVRRIVLSMKEFSHPGSTSKVMADINRALESTLTVCRNTWKHVATVDMDFDPNLPEIPCYPGELNQVFLNLIVNATHAIENTHTQGLGKITVSTKVDGDWIEIDVSDTGTGVPAAIMDRIFDPFFTTKPVGKGTGQGLAICKDVVVNKHGGRLDVDNVEGGGAVFTVRIPVGTHEETLPQEGTS